MFGQRIRNVVNDAVRDAATHGHATMNDIQGLTSLIGKIVTAAAEDINELLESSKKTVAEIQDGLTVETTARINLREIKELLEHAKDGKLEVVDIPITLINKIVLLEKTDQQPK